jgi:hypothetical protein
LPDGRIFGQKLKTPNNIYWPEKIGGQKLADFLQKSQKRGRQIFHSNLQGKFPLYAVFSVFLISEYVKQENNLSKNF